MKIFLEFIARNKRIYAKTYANFAPHEYIVKGDLKLSDRVIMIEFAKFIKANGYIKMFWGHPFTYYNIGKHMYRTMDKSAEDTELINRALISKN